MNKYNLFFDTLQAFVDEQQKQISSGKNDYNMVNVVRKENAEVGMHSNVIYSLIDPKGTHYQGPVFLNLFIKNVLSDLYSDFGEIQSIEAEEGTKIEGKENRRIDFTIKSDKYYIGIEMKIDAADLKDQLSDYFKDLTKKAEKDKNQEVRMYYLTKNGKMASSASSNDIKYKRISFSEHILNWLEECKKEVQNIPNLNLALQNYIDIVKKITGTYRGNIMKLEEFLKNKDNETLSVMYTLLDEIDQLQDNVQRDFINTLDAYLGDILEKYEKKATYIDYLYKGYCLRMYLDTSSGKFIIQIGDEKRFESNVDEVKRQSLLELFEGKQAFTSVNWKKGYGEMKLGKIRFQTQEQISQETKEFVNLFITAVDTQ